ncbi:MAG TPA: tripartite tricarboxylate transporter substrate binding protein [Xanthobacteraceae bacterium]|jgi:tripartite-type tricarboxylate transporter receptor subunit TctC|nr:tripartite tricarboxylate transporter substrate binding protein [Xanthobacteraceae bacterium]
MAWRARVRILIQRLLLAAFAVLSATPFGAARAEYPDRPITIIVCFPAGGGADIAARLIGTPLGDALGGNVIIENRGGAGGNIGITAAMRSAPDGYTLLVCSSAFVVNPSLYAQAAYDPFKDFEPIMALGASPNVITVPAQSEIKSLPELIAKAKANPGKLNWTSPGAGTTPYLAGEVIKLRTGITMEHIPFAGAGPATTAVLGGQVDMYTANIGSVSALIEDGKVRPLAVTALKRWPALPNVPTLEELGIHDAVSDTFYGIYAPAGTPQPIIGRIVKELTAILRREEIQDKYAKAGMPVVAESPAVFRARIAHEVPMYREIVDKAGLKIK